MKESTPTIGGLKRLVEDKIEDKMVEEMEELVYEDGKQTPGFCVQSFPTAPTGVRQHLASASGSGLNAIRRGH